MGEKGVTLCGDVARFYNSPTCLLIFQKCSQKSVEFCLHPINERVLSARKKTLPDLSTGRSRLLQFAANCDNICEQKCAANPKAGSLQRAAPKTESPAVRRAEEYRRPIRVRRTDAVLYTKNLAQACSCKRKAESSRSGAVVPKFGAGSQKRTKSRGFHKLDSYVFIEYESALHPRALAKPQALTHLRVRA